MPSLFNRDIVVSFWSELFTINQSTNQSTN